MNITKNNKNLWKSLYEAAVEFRDLNPWKKFDDSCVYGIQDPASGEICWCVIKDAADEVYGLVVYVGDEGFEMLDDMIDSYAVGTHDEEELSRVLNHKTLKVEFVNRDETDDMDHKVYKQLGLRFKGKFQYISIRRHDPGLFPWYINESQAVLLTHCLKQSIKIYHMVREREIKMTGFDDLELLVMVPEIRGEDMSWTPEYIEWPILEPSPEPEYIPDTFIINRIRKELRKKDSVLFLSIQYLLKPVQEKEGERPFFPRLALWVDGNSGMIIGNQLFSPDDLWKNFQNNLLEIIPQLEQIPFTIAVDSEMGLDLLYQFSDKLDIDLVYEPEHPLFSELRESMGKFF